MKPGVLEIEADEEPPVERAAAGRCREGVGVVCARCRTQSIAGRRVTRVWEVPSTTNAIVDLADQLAREGSSGSWSSRSRTTARVCVPAEARG